MSPGGDDQGMELLREAFDLVLPRHCAGCRAPGTDLCSACAMPLTLPPRPDHRRDVPRLWTVATYDHPVSDIVNAYKEQARTSLAIPLGHALAAGVRSALPP